VFPRPAAIMLGSAGPRQNRTFAPPLEMHKHTVWPPS